MFFFRAERTGTNVKGFGLMSHVPVIPLKVYVLSVVHILARGNPQQTTETDLGCVGAREASVLRSTEHHPHEFRFVLPICLLRLRTEAKLPFFVCSDPHDFNLGCGAADGYVEFRAPPRTFVL